MREDDGAAGDARAAASLVIRDVGRAVPGALPVGVDWFGGRCGHADVGAWVRRTRHAHDILLPSEDLTAPPVGGKRPGARPRYTAHPRRQACPLTPTSTGLVCWLGMSPTRRTVRF